MSTLIGILGPITEYWYLQDYWKPLTITNTPVGIEDYIFGFLIGGIGSVIYEEILGKKLLSRHNREHNWALIFTAFSGIAFICSLLLFYFFNINSIYASFIGCVLIIAPIILFRKDLWVDALWSGFFCVVILFSSYTVLLFIYPEMFEKIWFLHNLSGYKVGKIPIEEGLWAFGYGMIAGPLYEFYSGLKFANKKKK